MADERERLVVEIADIDRQLGQLQDQLELAASVRAGLITALVVLPGMSVRRAADLLGISPTAVQKAIERARTKAATA